MIGNVIAPFEGYVKPPANPDDYFDPSTHIATEENFIKFLQTGTYIEDVIGYKVVLSNSVDYNNGTWVIADVGHHANQPNTYDLISQDVFYRNSFSSSTQIWRDSNIRTLLNNTFYNGFSNDFKNHMNNITYDSNGSTYNDDKVILPSFTEVNGTTGTTNTAYVVEGTAYPIFTDNNSRKKYQAASYSYQDWLTRSRHTNYNTEVLIVSSNGNMSNTLYSNSRFIAPVLRVG